MVSERRGVRLLPVFRLNPAIHRSSGVSVRGTSRTSPFTPIFASCCPDSTLVHFLLAHEDRCRKGGDVVSALARLIDFIH